MMLDLAEDGCMLVLAKKWGMAILIYTVIAISYEGVLLGFFMYPLRKSQKDHHALLPIVKRCALSAMACFVNEIAFTCVHVFIERPLMLNTVTTNLKHIVYYLSLVASYNDWLKKMCVTCDSRVANISSKAMDTEDTTRKTHDSTP